MFAIHTMNLSSIDLNLLVVLEALISESHVGRAARKIGLSQPATSHALKRLRDLLGDPLLVRIGSRMELTPRAIGLRESLAEALQRVEYRCISRPDDGQVKASRPKWYGIREELGRIPLRLPARRNGAREVGAIGND